MAKPVYDNGLKGIKILYMLSEEDEYGNYKGEVDRKIMINLPDYSVDVEIIDNIDNW